ncbi:MAG TPA: glycogen/starch synthase, partial [Mesotoga sp.]|nr:glycogen/starch synthase [Mesotoga sp.]
RTLISVHNLAYQGVYPENYLRISGIERDRWGMVSSGDNINCLKAGLIASDMINTVSPTYAREIQTSEYGAGLDGVLRERKDDLIGILNGIDSTEYDPAKDRHLWVNFDSKNVEGKAINKGHLQDFVGLPRTDNAVIGLISRLVDQKGLDLIAAIKEDLMELPLQLIVLGTGEKKYEGMFERLQVECPDKIAAKITFNLDLAQKIYGGCDMFLMPSRYEPCGLGQLFAMRYGTVPVVRLTGGLADTVKEFDPSSFEGNGFGFYDYSPEELLETLKKAIKAYEDQRTWSRIVSNAMEEDFSWKASARNYLAVYEKILEVKGDA